MLDEMIKLVVANIPNMIGLVFAIAILLRVLDWAWRKIDELQSKLDALQNKTLEIALKCRDEEAKQEMLAFQQEQRKELKKQ